MKRLVLRISLALFFSETVLAGPAPTTHHLAPTPKTVTWGYFDPSTPPVLRVHSGDTVEVETLPGGGIQALEMDRRAIACFDQALAETQQGPGAPWSTRRGGLITKSKVGRAGG